MTYALWTPPLPVVPIMDGSTDEERLIKGRCWDLPAVQQAVSAGSLSIELTTTASDGLTHLGWRLRDVTSFFLALKPSYHYINSQWCLPPADGNHYQALPADAYEMGFNRIQGVENYRFEPHIYMKWAVREAVSEVVVFSFHQSTR